MRGGARLLTFHGQEEEEEEESEVVWVGTFIPPRIFSLSYGWLVHFRFVMSLGGFLIVIVFVLMCIVYGTVAVSHVVVGIAWFVFAPSAPARDFVSRRVM